MNHADERSTRIAISSVLVVPLLLAFATTTWANSLSEYHKRVQQAVSGLDTLAQSDEDESQADRAVRVSQTLAAVRNVLPEREHVEWAGTIFPVDNSWLHRELDRFQKLAEADRAASLAGITERLQALAERLTEIERARTTASKKDEARQKLSEILQRPEYARGRKETSALTRLLRAFWKWLQDLLPKPKPMTPGSAGFLTQLAQFLVVILAFGVIVYVIRLFGPRLFQKGRSRKKSKREPRIVLGEKLKPDQSAVDLLAEAEALARRGELRAAIRKAYIALLVELGDRKIVSLAQHKTNRDYLQAVRDLDPLYGNVKQLTDSFESHWYGFAKATEDDWIAFRARYKQALQ
ncbi:MAG: DUF4129 domain-containing protein [Pyrinomonadaceae bacterium]